MEWFKFTPAVTSQSTLLNNGEPISGALSSTWVERYRDPGEFELTARVSSGLRSFLPLGTLISHTNTTEVMMVENHEILEDEPNSDAILKISGRSLDAFLENRIAGTHQNWVTQSDTIVEYILPSATSWSQAATLINHHVYVAGVTEVGSSLSNIMAQAWVSESGFAEARTIKRGDLHSRVLELLNADDAGIRVLRTGKTLPGIGAISQTRFIIHKGQDKTSAVMFSTEAGDIDSAQYFWTNRLMKNAALVTGRYVETIIYGTQTDYDRRVMFIDASDIDGSLTAAPTGTALTDIRAKMTIRGTTALKAQKQVALVNAEVSSTSAYKYRTDYDIGDLVMVSGNYGEIAKMRVVEYVEIEDENGESGHPTLSVVS